MSTAVTLYDPAQLGPTQLGSDKDFKSKGTGRFLPRLKLYSGTAKAIQRGKISAGAFGVELQKDEVTKIGENVDCIVFATKRMAIDMSVPGVVIRSFDQSSDVFQRIMAKCDSGEKDTKCQYGSTFLIFERSLGRFLEFFYGAPTWAEEAEKMCAFLPISPADIARKAAEGVDVTGLTPTPPRACTISAQLIERPGRSWHIPVSRSCSTPFSNAPALADVQAEVRKFLTVAESKETKIGEADSRVV